MTSPTKLDPNKVVLHVVTKGQFKYDLELPLVKMLKLLQKLPGIMRKSTEGNLEYHRMVQKEIRDKLVRGETFSTSHTHEETVDLLIQVSTQVELCRVALETFDDEQPFPWFPDDAVASVSFEVTPA